MRGISIIKLTLLATCFSLFNFQTITAQTITVSPSEEFQVVQGFGGMRIGDNKVIFNPFLPKEWTSFQDYRIQKEESIDGYKFHLDENSWVMLRLSGTEPILRIYAESSNRDHVLDILQKTKDTVLA